MDTPQLEAFIDASRRAMTDLESDLLAGVNAARQERVLVALHRFRTRMDSAWLHAVTAELEREHEANHV